jgi:hypothetical protein
MDDLKWMISKEEEAGGGGGTGCIQNENPHTREWWE